VVQEESQGSVKAGPFLGFVLLIKKSGQEHKEKKEQAYYGICWFDLLPAEASRKVRALPAGTEGKASDYCGSL